MAPSLATRIGLSALGIAAAIALWFVLRRLIPPDPAATSMAVRLGFACVSLLPAVAVLAAMIAAQMATRFLGGAVDPTLGRDGPFLLVNQRAITNTVEQLAVFAPALLALAAGAPAAALPRVLALAGVFAASRILFWAGYLLRPAWRAPGMAATAMTGLTALAAAAAVWLRTA